MASAPVDPALKTKFATNSEIDIIIELKESTSTLLDKANVMKFESMNAKRTYVYQTMKAFTEAQQADILAFLGSRTTSNQVKGFWIVNSISVRGADLKLAEEVAARFADKIQVVRAGHVASVETPVQEYFHRPSARSWGIETVEAEAAWAAGYDGRGVRVSNTDTGVRPTHEALRDNYVGDNDYGWFDPYNGSPSPRDNNGHGTHTMGTIAGSQGIGVAPGAQWMACLGCSTSSCAEFALLGCGEWTACPTLADGSNANCDKAPVASGNSWGGGQGNSWYNNIINTWRSVGIAPVFSAGNSGSSCGTANSPADQPGAISVGSTTSTNALSSFSSRGPGRTVPQKPEISAPGSSIISASHNSDIGYATLSGTSMASPHVTGAFAVLKQKNPSLTIDQGANAIYSTAMQPPLSSPPCGGSTLWPNYHYGYGILNVFQAVNAV